MTNPIFNPQPNYSGVTIQIANPSVNVSPNGANTLPGTAYYGSGYAQNSLLGGGIYSACPQACYCDSKISQEQVAGKLPVNNPNASANTNDYSEQQTANTYPNAYPAQYYLNNYNYGVNGNGNGLHDSDKSGKDANNVNAQIYDDKSNNNDAEGQLNSIPNAAMNPEQYLLDTVDNSENDTIPQRDHSMNSYKMYADSDDNKISDMSTSKEIIADLNEREAKLQEDKKNTTEKKIVALTDEYIKSLENYLNNPNDEIRLMASKEILTRLDEDKDRYNDAALNALLNKMMQDPSKVIRIAALSAFASQLASGNDYTVQLLHNIQANPDADKEDVLQAADILLKMSAGVEVKNIPNPQTKDSKQQQQ